MRARARRRGQLEIFTLSFLDCVCCGFGAIVLLLVLTKGGETRALEKSVEDLDRLVARLQDERFAIRGETTRLTRDLEARVTQVSDERAAVARLLGDLTRIQGEFRTSRELSEVQDILEGRMLAAQQTLSEEMERLNERSFRRPAAAPVGGIPVDSEYIVFVIDTSGSMFNGAWPALLAKMEQVLDAYPQVKGMQVLNDEGIYMFPRYAGRWIPDTPSRRAAVLDRLRTWSVFSNSSPVEGIERAIRDFAAPDRRISIYVLGDEFTGDSIDEVVHEIRRLNRKDSRGRQPVRIHAIGFPTMFVGSGFPETTGVRFAALMRIVCQENGGAFVGLNSTRP